MFTKKQRFEMLALNNDLTKILERADLVDNMTEDEFKKGIKFYQFFIDASKDNAFVCERMLAMQLSWKDLWEKSQKQQQKNRKDRKDRNERKNSKSAKKTTHSHQEHKSISDTSFFDFDTTRKRHQIIIAEFAKSGANPNTKPTDLIKGDQSVFSLAIVMLLTAVLKNKFPQDFPQPLSQECLKFQETDLDPTIHPMILGFQKPTSPERLVLYRNALRAAGHPAKLELGEKGNLIIPTNQYRVIAINQSPDKAKGMAEAMQVSFNKKFPASENINKKFAWASSFHNSYFFVLLGLTDAEFTEFHREWFGTDFSAEIKPQLLVPENAHEVTETKREIKNVPPSHGTIYRAPESKQLRIMENKTTFNVCAPENLELKPWSNNFLTSVELAPKLRNLGTDIFHVLTLNDFPTARTKSFNHQQQLAFQKDRLLPVFSPSDPTQTIKKGMFFMFVAGICNAPYEKTIDNPQYFQIQHPQTGEIVSTVTITNEAGLVPYGLLSTRDETIPGLSFDDFEFSDDKVQQQIQRANIFTQCEVFCDFPIPQIYAAEDISSGSVLRQAPSRQLYQKLNKLPKFIDEKGDPIESKSIATATLCLNFATKRWGEISEELARARFRRNITEKIPMYFPLPTKGEEKIGECLLIPSTQEIGKALKNSPHQWHIDCTYKLIFLNYSIASGYCSREEEAVSNIYPRLQHELDYRRGNRSPETIAKVKQTNPHLLGIGLDLNTPTVSIALTPNVEEVTLGYLDKGYVDPDITLTWRYSATHQRLWCSVHPDKQESLNLQRAELLHTMAKRLTDHGINIHPEDIGYTNDNILIPMLLIDVLPTPQVQAKIAKAFPAEQQKQWEKIAKILAADQKLIAACKQAESKGESKETKEAKTDSAKSPTAAELAASLAKGMGTAPTVGASAEAAGSPRSSSTVVASQNKLGLGS